MKFYYLFNTVTEHIYSDDYLYYFVEETTANSYNNNQSLLSRNNTEVRSFEADKDFINKEVNFYNLDQVSKPIWFNEPWYQEKFFELRTFDSVSETDPSKVMYYPNEEKGIKGIHTIAKPGVFLKKFFGDVLDEKQIKYWTDKHKESFIDGPTCEFASTPEEIRQVYEMSATFSSCMQHKASHWRGLGKHHPVEAYGAGDLKLAYIKQGDRLLARALVWPEKNKVGRVYGDGVQLRTALKKHGIKTDSDSTYYDTFQGARIKKIVISEGSRKKGPDVVLPYVDGRFTGLVTVDDDTLVISDGSASSNVHEYYANDQASLREAMCKCEVCGNYHSNTREVVIKLLDKYVKTEDAYQYWCEDCSYRKVIYDQYASVYASKEIYEELLVYNDDYYGETTKVVKQWYEDEVANSDVTGKLYLKKSLIKLKSGENIAKCEIDRFAFKSHIDGAHYKKDDYTEYNGYSMTKNQYELVSQSTNSLFPAWLN